MLKKLNVKLQMTSPLHLFVILKLKGRKLRLLFKNRAAFVKRATKRKYPRLKVAASTDDLHIRKHLMIHKGHQ